MDTGGYAYVQPYVSRDMLQYTHIPSVHGLTAANSSVKVPNQTNKHVCHAICKQRPINSYLHYLITSGVRFLKLLSNTGAAEANKCRLGQRFITGWVNVV